MSLHNSSTYATKYVESLDELLDKYTEADVLAEARSYRDDERNRRVEQLAVEYDREKARALQAGAA